jgi:four helix bundle protein
LIIWRYSPLAQPIRKDEGNYKLQITNDKLILEFQPVCNSSFVVCNFLIKTYHLFPSGLIKEQKMVRNDLIERTQNFSLAIKKLVERVPKRRTANVLIGQILRSATSVAANYRVVPRAKSRADFINKLKIVEEETEETIFWLEMILKGEMIALEEVNPLLREGRELQAIIVASIKTVRARTKG